jgi:hypothetical protein
MPNNRTRWQRLNTNSQTEAFMKSKNVRTLLSLTIMSMIVVLNVPGQILKPVQTPIQPSQPAPSQQPAPMKPMPGPAQPAPVQPVQPLQPAQPGQLAPNQPPVFTNRMPTFTNQMPTFTNQMPVH